MKRQVLALGLAAVTLCGAARADLLVNGSFEDGAFAPPYDAAMTLEPGATTMTGWEVFNASVTWIGVGDPWELDAEDGDMFLDLTAYRTGPPFGGVRQTITTVPGHKYRVSLYLGSSTFWGRPSAVTVSASSASETFTSPLTGTMNDWEPHSMSFTATEALTTVSIVGSEGRDYIGLDNVSVVDLDAAVVVDGREWRQLGDTTYVRWNEVAVVCPTDGITPCSGSIYRSVDGAYIDVTGWTWARNSDVQALWESIIQPGVTNFPTEIASYAASSDPDIEQALSGEDGWFVPTNTDVAGRYLIGLTATDNGTVAYRPDVRDAIENNTDWVRLGTTLPKTGRQSYTGVWLFRPYQGVELQLQSLTLKLAEVAGCKSVTGKVTLSAPAPEGGVVVTLSDTLADATTPATVKLLAGATSKSFTVKTVAVDTRQVGKVSATLGATTLSQPLALRPMGMLSLTLTPTTVAGTLPVAGTAKLECKAGPGPITIDLTSSEPAAANPVAASIAVPEGLQSVPVDVTTSKVLVKTKATISATANDLTKSRTLTVTPAASVTPTVLNFGTVKVGTTSAPLVATLANKGAIAVTIDSIVVTGTYASWFPMTENCPNSLAAGASCTISVRFAPIAAATRSAKVTITTSATATPSSVTVKGTGAL
jgi:hypothetical protein